MVKNLGVQESIKDKARKNLNLNYSDSSADRWRFGSYDFILSYPPVCVHSCMHGCERACMGVSVHVCMRVCC